MSSDESTPDVEANRSRTDIWLSSVDGKVTKRLTSDPADFFGITDRGRLGVGLAADITVFDPATVGSSNRGERRYDLPGGGKRMVMPSRGILHTIVNGECLYENGAVTEARSGQVLRS